MRSIRQLVVLALTIVLLCFQVVASTHISSLLKLQKRVLSSSPSSPSGALAKDETTTPTSAPASTNPMQPQVPHGLRFLYQNDLNWTRAVSQEKTPGFLMLNEPQSFEKASAGCSALNEQLVDATKLSKDGFAALQNQLSFLAYEGSLAPGTQFWIANRQRYTWSGRALVGNRALSIQHRAADDSKYAKSSALCTQSAPWSNLSGTDASSKWWVEAQSGNLTFRGYRDALSFRFGALKYGNYPKRFTHSTLNPQATGLISATDSTNSSACVQGLIASYTEDCLVANVFTTYLPRPSSSSSSKSPGRRLRPVMFWVHGGGYVSGSGLDPNFLGGNLASRDDVVVVTPNYRLGLLGFAALSERIGLTGNYALGDVITALKWVRAHIAAFGGDPENVTVFGQSAGANVLLALLSSPEAAGLFHGAILQSPQPGDSYVPKPTVSEAMSTTINNAALVGCKVNPSNTATTPPSYSNADLDTLAACLRAAPTANYITFVSVQPVVDGKIIVDRSLDLRNPSSGSASGHVNRVPLMTGFMRDELGSLGLTLPPTGLNLSESLKGAGVSPENTTTVLNNPDIFRVPQGVPNGNQNLSVAVASDINSPSGRCGAEAEIYAFAKNHVFPKVYAYTFDTRAYQLPFYDPFNYCQPKSSEQLKSGMYGLCHSGDLLPVWNTYGWYGYKYRDALDLPWSRNIADQWTAFARWKDPYVRKSYLQARGYDLSTRPSARWQSVSVDAPQLLSIGPSQYMESLAQHGAECNAFGKGLTYTIDGLKSAQA